MRLVEQGLALPIHRFRLSVDDLAKAAITALKIQHTWAAPEAITKRVTVWNDFPRADRIVSVSSNVIVYCRVTPSPDPLEVWDIESREKIFSFPETRWGDALSIWHEFVDVNERAWYLIFSDEEPYM